MARNTVLAASAALILLAAPAQAALKARAIARLEGQDGKPVATAVFDALGHGVLITFDLHDLPPGPHAIHLHTSGNCDPKTGFTSAGPIFSLMAGKQHGYLAEGGPETGDLPNQFAGADGHLHASVENGSFNIGNGKKSIFDHDDVSVIVDARGDDYRAQPLGNAWDCIACGVVMRTRGPAKWDGIPRHKTP
jgi:superoxide dismutase, Cu-Zn family